MRDEGATSTESWLEERYGVSPYRSVADPRIQEGLGHTRHLVGGLRAGEISLDKVRVVADVATPETDLELCERAKECSVRELADIARSSAEMARASSPTRSQSDRRFLRFNDPFRTILIQLPTESYVRAKAGIDGHLKGIPSEGEHRWTSAAATPSWG